jgi:uncharacterized membrane protein YoaK (UPF0700 family)
MSPVGASVGADSARNEAAILEGALLAFVAGYVDTCGFIALFGLFTAHVTGNLVLIGAAIVSYHGNVLAKLLAIPVFIVTVAIARCLTIVLQDRRKNAAVPLLGAQIVLLAAFLASGIAVAPVTDADTPRAILTGMLAVAAMSFQNAASRTVYAMHTPTTVMTGNVTQAVIDIVDMGLGRGTPEARIRIRKMVPAILVFTAGALIGALAYAHVGFWCLVIPIAVLVFPFFRELGRAA